MDRTPSDARGPVAAEALDDVGPQNEFYPLAIGNRWHIDSYEVFEFYPAGSDVSDGAEEFHAEEEWLLDQTEQLFGRTYVVQSQTIVQDLPEPGVFHQWIRFRQDQAGLYEADVVVGDPPGDGAKAASIAEPQATPARRTFDLTAFGPRALEHAPALRTALAELELRRARIRGALRGVPAASPPGGVLPDELTRLNYPLHPGASWYVLDGFLEARVEGWETLVTPAGRFPSWRIRLHWADSSFEDTILMWVGRCGILKLYVQASSTFTDPSGNVVGTIRVEETDIVEALDIQERPCGSRPDRPVLTH